MDHRHFGYIYKIRNKKNNAQESDRPPNQETPCFFQVPQTAEGTRGPSSYEALHMEEGPWFGGNFNVWYGGGVL